MPQKRRAGRWGRRMLWAVLLILVLLFVGIFYAAQHILLENAQALGNELADSYSLEESRNIRSVEILIDLGAQYLDDQIQAGASQSALEDWMKNFFQKVTAVTGQEVLDPYGVVHGQIVAAVPWWGDAEYDYTQTEWYQKALQAQGDPIFTDAYPDAITGRPVLTIAQKCQNSDDVIAFDIFPENFSVQDNAQALPEGSSCFFCDSSGTLLYARTQMEEQGEALTEYVRVLYEKIQLGQLDGAQAYIYDLSGEKQAVYFNTTENGWLSIITIPYSALLGGLRLAFQAALLLCGGALVILAAMSLRERRIQRRMDRVSETVAALGNLYYAIYRVDVAQGTYEAIKGSDLIQQLPPTGQYPQLVESVSEVIDPETFSQFQSSFSLPNLQRLLEEQVPDFGGDFRRRFGEEYRWVNVRLLFDPSLQPHEAVLCFRLVDGEKAAQLRQLQLMEHALDSAKQSEAAREQFFSQMSHDMRTPLNVIIGTAQLAQRTCEEKSQTYLKKIQVAASQLLNLINDILEISRIEQAGLHLENRQFDLGETVRQCVSAFQPQAELQEKELTLSLQLDRSQVYGDAFRLQQVLNNLLSNALKFTEKGDRIQVSVEQLQRDKHAKYRLIVADTGIGMSKEFLPKLFLPYERETRFSTQTVLGTGLGMPIVKSIVTSMGGQIQVDSTLGEGSTFTLTLPLEAAEEQTPPPDAPAPQELTGSLSGKRVLLAEDFDMNMEITTELLQMCGAQVTQAWNGQEAVEQFQASEPGYFDVILMDMNMPVMDGCTAAAAIRALDRPDSQSVPILALTANAFAEDIAASSQAGMNAHIAKPVDMEQLAALLQRLTADN